MSDKAIHMIMTSKKPLQNSGEIKEKSIWANPFSSFQSQFEKFSNYLQYQTDFEFAIFQNAEFANSKKQRSD